MELAAFLSALGLSPRAMFGAVKQALRSRFGLMRRSKRRVPVKGGLPLTPAALQRRSWRAAPRPAALEPERAERRAARG